MSSRIFANCRCCCCCPHTHWLSRPASCLASHGPPLLDYHPMTRIYQVYILPYISIYCCTAIVFYAPFFCAASYLSSSALLLYYWWYDIIRDTQPSICSSPSGQAISSLPPSLLPPSLVTSISHLCTDVRSVRFRSDTPHGQKPASYISSILPNPGSVCAGVCVCVCEWVCCVISPFMCGRIGRGHTAGWRTRPEICTVFVFLLLLACGACPSFLFVILLWAVMLTAVCLCIIA